jgi:hypothetical protein
VEETEVDDVEGFWMILIWNNCLIDLKFKLTMQVWT